MRQIEKQMCAAVSARKNWRNGNTEVVVENGIVHVLLHNNEIWREYLHGKREKMFNLQGWNTPTTRSRLHALGVGVTQKNYAPMYNGQQISDWQWHCA